MIPTGSIPDNGEIVIAYQNENYKVRAIDFVKNGYPVTLLNTAGNSLGYLTGIAQPASETDPVELLGELGSFWLCGCTDTTHLVYSYAVPALWPEVTVDSFFPFRYYTNFIDYMIHADPYANCLDSNGQAIPDAWTLSSMTTTNGVNYTEATHGITDANKIDYYGQPNKKNYIVKSIDGNQINSIYDCRIFSSHGYKSPVEHSFYVKEYKDFLLGGTRWSIVGGAWDGENVDFYYGFGHIGDHSSNGKAFIDGSHKWFWEWDKDTGALSIIHTPSLVNTSGVTPADCPLGTAVTMAGNPNFTMTRIS